ncbi:MAG: phosphoglycerate mutase family protein, partial [Clostridia bacterium]|nr:phosphoglycerate mutase family protein [Clostridia bacterium]
MTTFLLIRHGESLANVNGRFAGHLDVPLSETGHTQA